MARRILRKHEAKKETGAILDANELKSVVRDGLFAMNAAERAEFIVEIENEMRHSGLHLSSYLVPLGIPGRSAEDMTPTEVGHLVRYLKINVPQAMRAIEKAMSHFSAFAEKMEQSGHRLAA